VHRGQLTGQHTPSLARCTTARFSDTEGIDKGARSSPDGLRTGGYRRFGSNLFAVSPQLYADPKLARFVCDSCLFRREVCHSFSLRGRFELTSCPDASDGHVDVRPQILRQRFIKRLITVAHRPCATCRHQTSCLSRSWQLRGHSEKVPPRLPWWTSSTYDAEVGWQTLRKWWVCKVLVQHRHCMFCRAGANSSAPTSL
jgi:hypothetical protein